MKITKAKLEKFVMQFPKSQVVDLALQHPKAENYLNRRVDRSRLHSLLCHFAICAERKRVQDTFCVGEDEALEIMSERPSERMLALHHQELELKRHTVVAMIILGYIVYMERVNSLSEPSIETMVSN